MIGIVGYIRAPVSARIDLARQIETYVPACRAEPGCRAFTLAFDALDPDFLRVFEIWDDDRALKAHIESGHETEWREACKRLGASEHALKRYEIAAVMPV